jgi:hypothetical protein
MWAYVFTGIVFSMPWTYALVSAVGQYPPAPLRAFFGGVGIAVLMSAPWPVMFLVGLVWYAMLLWVAVALLAYMAG